MTRNAPAMAKQPRWSTRKHMLKELGVAAHPRSGPVPLPYPPDIARRLVDAGVVVCAYWALGGQRIQRPVYDLAPGVCLDHARAVAKTIVLTWPGL